MTESLHRRKFLVTAGAAGSLLSVGCTLPIFKNMSMFKAISTSGSPDRIRIRQAWNASLAPDIKTTYAKAVKLLKDNDDPSLKSSTGLPAFLTWQTLANIHQNSCPHSNWYFLPWHRLYLHYFEMVCQLASGDPTFALPYWDWSDQKSIPAEFFSKSGDFSVFATDRDMTATQSLSEEFIGRRVVDDILAIDDFYAFCSGPAVNQRDRGQSGQLEGTPHNRVHGSIGGIMGSFLSPIDPIFWLHHCNVDRLWETWIRAHPKSVMPYAMNGQEMASRWLNFELKLHPEQNGPVMGSFAISDGKTIAGKGFVKELTDGSMLGYSFDSVEGTKGVGTKLVAGAAGSRQIEKLKLVAPETFAYQDMYVATILSSDVPLRERILASLAQPSTAILLIANKLPHPTDEELRKKLIIRFFAVTDETVDVKNEKFIETLHNPQPLALPGYLSSFSFFMNHGHDGHVATEDILVDLSDWLRTFLKDGKVFPQKVRLIAIALDPDEKPDRVHIMRNLIKDVDLSIEIRV